MGKRLAWILTTGLLLIGAWQAENVADWWWLRNYEPPIKVAAIAENVGFSGQGLREFYLADPKLNNKQEFSNNCPVGETTLVLGCYSSGKIYVLEVERAELAKVMEVTAAHEMLHAAYLELSRRDRSHINKLLEEFFATHADSKLRELVEEYERVEPGQRLNELHSLLGTQISPLSQELEDYYSRYFNNRQQIVNAYIDYEGVFAELDNQITAFSSQIDSLKQQIANLEQQLDSQRAELENTNQQLNILLAQGNVSQYNSFVPIQNSQVRQYNALIAQYQGLVSVHNTKVDQLNALALKQNQLRDSLDSTKQPIDN